MIKPDSRIRQIVGEIPEGSRIADIGCDHGKTAVYAILTGRAVYAVATDISAPSLDKAVRLADKEGVKDRMDFRIGDGLVPVLEGEADTVIIAGMGGREIIKILSYAPCKFPRYIFAPHQEPPLLRDYLAENGYRTIKDAKVKCAGKFYDIIVCAPGKAESLNYRNRMLGSSEPSEPDFKEFLAYETMRLERLFSKIPNEGGKYAELTKYYGLIKELNG